MTALGCPVVPEVNIIVQGSCNEISSFKLISASSLLATSAKLLIEEKSKDFSERNDSVVNNKMDLEVVILYIISFVVNRVFNITAIASQYVCACAAIIISKLFVDKIATLVCSFTPS